MGTSRRIRIVCVSDTHNDDPTLYIPNADILLHAGDLTDNGTPEELEKALNWIRKLPQKRKIIIPGNHDVGLDPLHKGYSPKMHSLFTSPEVRADGVVFLGQSDPTFLHDDLLSIYANPTQPDFLKSNYAFTYHPYPSPEATAAWASAPDTSRGPIEIWLSHGAPKGRLDQIHIAGLMGCEAQRKKVAKARPLVCVFGHFHCAYGVEKVVWKASSDEESDDVLESVTLADESPDCVYDFTTLIPGKETVFINAAWMTMEKGKVEKRNKPIVIDLEYTFTDA